MTIDTLYDGLGKFDFVDGQLRKNGVLTAGIEYPVFERDFENGYKLRKALPVIVSTPDTTPAAFTFTDKTDVAPSTVIVSDPVTITDIDAPSPFAVTNGEVSVENGAWVTSGTIENNQQMRARHTSAAGSVATIDTIVNVGGVVDTFTSTTMNTATPTMTSSWGLGQNNILSKDAIGDNNVWSNLGSCGVSNNVGVHPISGQTIMDRIYPTASGNYAGRRQQRRLKPNTEYIFCADIKADGKQWAVLDGGQNLGYAAAYFDIVNGLAGALQSGAHDPFIINLGGGVWRCGFKKTTGATAVTEWVSIYPTDANNNAAVTAGASAGIQVANIYLGTSAPMVLDTVTPFNMWSNATGLTLNAGPFADADGGTTARKATLTSGGSSDHSIFMNKPAAPELLNLKFDAKAIGNPLFLWISLAGAQRIYLNLVTGAITGTPNPEVEITIVDKGNSWREISARGPTFAGNMYVGVALTDGINYFAGDGASGFYFANERIIT